MGIIGERNHRHGQSRYIHGLTSQGLTSQYRECIRTFFSLRRLCIRLHKCKEQPMISVKNILQLASVAAFSAIGFAAVPTAASAAVVCNGDGDCWHADRTIRYPRSMVVVRHPDDWYFRRN